MSEQRSAGRSMEKMACFVAAFGVSQKNKKIAISSSRTKVVVAADDLKLTKMPIPYPGDEDWINDLAIASGLEVAQEVSQEDIMEAEAVAQSAQTTVPQRRDKNYTLKKGEIAVRFTNTPYKIDQIVPSEPGKNLLKLGDSADIKIPRGCRTGLCGACTVDLEDPTFPGGKQTIRACQTSVMLPQGCDEMVIDLYRMEPKQQFSRKDPFMRFEKLDTQYKAAASPRGWGEKRIQKCTTCEGTGAHICPECLGEGVMSSNEKVTCYVCMGRTCVRCADCQGNGERTVK
eukprot:Plantae.Rhodophyta-Purpureofilum_apyrenoidigerum.ctg3259.p1 GENE.Plantae.Rhodophyta-Purpureofilum_apyrenoidigerum.ctg3259~~Plantae.Rhodophyta-Purpureofilum_apyrenoidigerum.ctg3259.p1  ORF type:complete len:287 (-),score=33.55 Plantae.Rhodophyta-Purpureofilum_apyrenoidigerum.ctg3259:308-1168(-)